MKSIQDIAHVRYINLEHRTDRKEQVQNELRRIGWLEKSKRYNAVRLKDGRAGCTVSHLRCLEEAREAKLSHLVIVEDDIQFLNPALFTEQLDKFLSSGVDWDVILLAGNNLPPYVRVSDAAVKVTQCQTTTGYIVNERYYDQTIQARIPNNFFQATIRMLERSGDDAKIHYAGNVVDVPQPYLSQYHRIHPELPVDLPVLQTKYCSGRFYVLSADAVADLLKKKHHIEKEFLEDYAIGLHLDESYKRTMKHLATNVFFQDTE